MNQKTIEIHIPQMLVAHLTSSIRKDNRDALALIVWQILRYSKGNKPVPISHKAFAKLVRAGSVKGHQDLLEKWGIMECNGIYSSRSYRPHSLGYRITDVAMDSGLIKYELVSKSYQKKIGRAHV